MFTISFNHIPEIIYKRLLPYFAPQYLEIQ